MTAITPHKVRFNLADVSLWTGVLAAPLAWCFNLEMVYALADLVEADSKFRLHFSSGLTLVVAICGLAVAWRNTRNLQRARVEPLHSEPNRVGMMAHLGLMTSSLFVLAIIAQWIAVAMLRPIPG